MSSRNRSKKNPASFIESRPKIIQKDNKDNLLIEKLSELEISFNEMIIDVFANKKLEEEIKQFLLNKFEEVHEIIGELNDKYDKT